MLNIQPRRGLLLALLLMVNSACDGVELRSVELPHFGEGDPHQEPIDIAQQPKDLCLHPTYTVDHECDTFTMADPQAPGGGAILRLCGLTKPDGSLLIQVRKDSDNEQSWFGKRPYRVFVSDPGSKDCGPDQPEFTQVASNPFGIGTPQLIFDPFMLNWEPGQLAQDLCVTASVQQGDLDFDPDNPRHQHWWYSKKFRIYRDCA